MKKLITFIISSSLILISSFLFQNRKQMDRPDTYIYFSGAANISKMFDWKISISDYNNVKNLSINQYQSYKHQRTKDLKNFQNNSYGYVLIIYIAKTIFYFLGDIQAVILFQVIVHLFICVWLILFVFDNDFKRYLFLLLYAANPVIIHFVTFPFYYFWLFIPSISFIVYILRPNWRNLTLISSIPFCLLSILIRPTTVFLVLYLYLASLFYVQNKRSKIISLLTIIAITAGIYSVKNINNISKKMNFPAHQLYVGLGAYPNSVGIDSLSDATGLNFFKSSTNILYYNDPTGAKSSNLTPLYNRIILKRYVEIAKNNPLLIIRNAFYNILQSFSMGYDVDRRWVTNLSTILGGFILLFLAFRKQWIWIAALLFVSISYVWYFPPIPAYNFAAYPLLVTSLILSFNDIISEHCDKSLSEKKNCNC
jgi:hypothetical protein